MESKNVLVYAMSKEIADRFGEALKRSGMTKYALAHAAKLSTTYIDRWETGDIKKPGYDALLALAKALEVSPDWLLGRTDDIQAKVQEARAPYDKRDDDYERVVSQVFHLSIFDLGGVLEQWAALPEKEQELIAGIIRLFKAQYQGDAKQAKQK